MTLPSPVQALLVSAVALAACRGPGEPPPEAELPTVEVVASTLASEEIRGAEPVAGTVRPRLHATLEAKVPGRVRAVLVKVGDEVQAGQVVVKLAASELEARLRQARAVLAQAKNELVRYRALYEQQASTRQELEGVRTSHAVALATVQEIASRLREATVRAPFAGVITGDLVDVGDLATPGRPLLTLEAPGDFRLEAPVSEALMGFIELGQPVPVELGDGRRLEGTIGEIAPSADASSRTFLVKVDLPGADEVRTGQYGRALFPTRQTEILRVPVQALVRRGQLEIVFVIEDGRARLRLVKSGKRFGDLVEVASGLTNGETIVVEGAARLLDGQPTEIR